MKRINIKNIFVLGALELLIIGFNKDGISSESSLDLHPIDENFSEAKESEYSSRIWKPLKQWPPPGFPDLSQDLNPNSNPIWMRGIRTPGKPTYIGTEKRILIHSPLKNVAAMIENFEGYPEIYPDLISVRIKARDRNKIITTWERKSPVFFVPNIKYDQIYVIDRTSPKRVAYRYQLRSGNSLNHSDGLIVLEAKRDLTLLTAFDFFDASWGILGSLATSRIWRESLEGSYRGDIAFKSHAEHPEWSFEQLTKESERILNQFPVEPIQYLDHFEW